MLHDKLPFAGGIAWLRLDKHFWVASLVLLSGCNDSDRIHRYQAPKPATMAASGSMARTGGLESPHAAQTEVPQRMLAAIIPHAGQAWFFKVMGPPEQVAGFAQGFEQLLRSTKIVDGKPQWQLPDGWQEQPGSGMRFATLLLGQDVSELELTVIPLPIPAGDETQYILSNINRWRGQLGLPPVSLQQLAEQSTTIELDGAQATMVDLTSPGQAEPSPTSTVDAGGTEDSGGALSYTTPEGWRPGQLVVTRGGITLRHEAAFDVRDGDQSAEITVDLLPAGPLLDNVNRWRGQIGLPDATAAQLAEMTSQLEIDGVSADYFELVGAAQTILGVIAPRGSQAWYFKLRGDSQLAEREKERFRSFATSVRFR